MEESSFNMKETAEWWTESHKLFIGDSQVSAATNYWVQVGLLAVDPQRFHYFIGDTTNSSALVPSRALLSVAGMTVTNTASDSSTTNYGVAEAVAVRPAVVLTFASNIADGTSLGTNGIILNRCFTTNDTSQQQMPWANCPSANAGSPWWHGTHLKQAGVFWNVSNSVRNFAQNIRRHGTSSSNTGTVQQVDLGAADNLLKRTQWTDALADAANYQPSSNGKLNDHDVRYELLAATGGSVDETSKAIYPVAVITARCDVSGNIPTNPDGVSYNAFDAIGRSGASVGDLLTLLPQDALRQYLAATVLGTRPKLLVCLAATQNSEAAYISNGVTTKAYRDDLAALVARIRAAFFAAFPQGQIRICLIQHWEHSSAAGQATDALSESQLTHIMSVAREFGCSVFSFYRAYNGRQPHSGLHPQNIAEGVMHAYAFLDVVYGLRNSNLRRERTRPRYSPYEGEGRKFGEYAPIS